MPIKKSLCSKNGLKVLRGKGRKARDWRRCQDPRDAMCSRHCALSLRAALSCPSEAHIVTHNEKTEARMITHLKYWS